jgi:hypothetical protein
MHSKYGLCVAVHLPDLFITKQISLNLPMKAFASD